jgi:hypothetical protein
VSERRAVDNLSSPEQRRAIRRNTILLSLVALAIYVAFIASGVIKAQP